MALSSTSAFAQEAQPTTPPPASEPAPTVSTQPAPAVDPAPVSTADEPTVAPAETVAPKHVLAARPKHVAAAQPKVTSSRTVSRTEVAKAAVPVAATPASAAPAPAEPAVKPVVSTNAPPAQPAKPVSTAPAAKPDSTALELGGGALAIVALGAGAFALSRRRRDDDELIEDRYEPETVAAAEPAVHHEPVVSPEPAMIAPELSAFGWGDRTHVDARREMGSDDRQPGETWVERAHRGPSPENPSLSLKKRLKRAAFFDKREQEVEAGKAEPLDPEAGLPDAAVDEMREREFENA
jgi:hypothetical protein